MRNGWSGSGEFTSETRASITTKEEHQMTALMHCISLLTLTCLCGRFPVVCRNDWQADLTLLVDIGMVNFCLELNFRWLEWIFWWECHLDAKCSFVVRCIVLRKKGQVTRCCFLHLSGSLIKLAVFSYLQGKASRTKGKCHGRRLRCLEMTLVPKLWCQQVPGKRKFFTKTNEKEFSLGLTSWKMKMKTSNRGGLCEPLW